MSRNTIRFWAMHVMCKVRGVGIYRGLISKCVCLERIGKILKEGPSYSRWQFFVDAYTPQGPIGLSKLIFKVVFGIKFKKVPRRLLEEIWDIFSKTFVFVSSANSLLPLYRPLF